LWGFKTPFCRSGHKHKKITMQCSVGCMNMHHHLHVIYNELVDAVGEKYTVGDSWKLLWMTTMHVQYTIHKGKQPEYR